MSTCHSAAAAAAAAACGWCSSALCAFLRPIVVAPPPPPIPPSPPRHTQGVQALVPHYGVDPPQMLVRGFLWGEVQRHSPAIASLPQLFGVPLQYSLPSQLEPINV